MKFLLRDLRAKRKPDQKKGDLHFQRWRLLPFGLPWFNVYIHVIVRPSRIPYCHDHPWWFWSLVLWGSYTEEYRENIGTDEDSVLNVGDPTYSKRGWLSFKRMGVGSFHNLHMVHKKTFTLVITGKRKRTWGYYIHDQNIWVSKDDFAKFKINMKSFVKHEEKNTKSH